MVSHQAEAQVGEAVFDAALRVDQVALHTDAHRGVGAPAVQGIECAHAVLVSGQLGEAQADQTDLDTHRRTYEVLKTSGLLGGEPRAIWVEDLLRISAGLGLQAHVSFTLGSPQAVDLPQAQAIGAKVTRHTLEYSFTRVHELEVLQLTQQYLQAHQDVARLMGCQLEQPAADGLSARCRVNFLHIEPPVAQGQNRAN